MMSDQQPRQPAMSLDELFEIYVKKRLRMRSPRTVTLYRHSINAFQKTLGRPATTDDFNDDALEEHMQRVMDSGLSVASANKDYAQLSAIWRFAHRNRYCEAWPNVQAYPESDRVPLAWMPDELDRLFRSIEQEQGLILGTPARMWWKALICVLLDSGERIGAILQLKRSDLHGNCILVPAPYRKRRTREMMYQLLPETLATLNKMIALHKSPKLFPWNKCSTYIYHKYGLILERAGLSTDARSKFHRIRRTVASAVQSQGGDATTALDHSCSRVTQKSYLDPRVTVKDPTCKLVAQWRHKKGD